MIIITSIEIRWLRVMPHNRRISWNAALRDTRSDRVRAAPGVISARSLIQAFVRIRRIHLVNQAGKFDCVTIMGLAAEAAKAHRLRTGATWSVSMSVGLSAAWKAARAARLATEAKGQMPVRAIGIRGDALIPNIAGQFIRAATQRTAMQNYRYR